MKLEDYPAAKHAGKFGPYVMEVPVICSSHIPLREQQFIERYAPKAKSKPPRSWAILHDGSILAQIEDPAHPCTPILNALASKFTDKGYRYLRLAGDGIGDEIKDLPKFDWDAPQAGATATLESGGQWRVICPFWPTLAMRLKAVGGEQLFADDYDSVWILANTPDNQQGIAMYFGLSADDMVTALLPFERCRLERYRLTFYGYLIAERRARDAPVQLGKGVTMHTGAWRQFGDSVRHPKPRPLNPDKTTMKIVVPRDFAEIHKLTIA